MHPEASISPAAVRAWRGDRPRSEVSRLVGVTPLTVYRWELPEGAAEARRPRGQVARRLRGLMAAEEAGLGGGAEGGGAGASGAERAADSVGDVGAAGRAADSDGADAPWRPAPEPAPWRPFASADAPWRPAPEPAPWRPAPAPGPAWRPAGPAASGPEAAPAAAEAARAATWAAALCEGALAATEAEVRGALARGEVVTAPGRAVAAAILARICLIQRGDAVAALATLGPWVAAAEAPGWSATARAEVLVTSALLHAQALAEVFDAARVAACLATARSLGPLRADLAVVGLAAEVSAAFSQGDTAGVRAVLARADLRPEAQPAPLLRGLLTELTGHLALVAGNPAESMRALAAATSAYEQGGFGYFAARVELLLGLRLLDDAHAPVEALAAARRAHERLRAAGAIVGQSFLLHGRLTGEALLRLGRFPEAERAFRAAIAAAGAVRWSPHPVAGGLTRLFLYTGRIDEALAWARELQAWDGPAQREITRTCGMLYEGWALQLAGREPARAVAQVDHAVEIADTRVSWSFLQREAQVLALGMRVRLRQAARARTALAHVERMLERLPSAWYAAQVRRYRGVLALTEGHAAEGQQMLEAAVAAFELAGDRPEALITRKVLARERVRLGDPDAQAALERVEAEIDALGMVPTSFSAETVGPAAAAPPPAVPARALPPLAVPVERLTLRGVGPDRIAQELVEVIAGLAPGRGVCVEEIGPRGTTVLVGAVVPHMDGFDFGDGTGRHLRLGVEGPVGEDVRAAARVLANVAGLSMEVASLRGFAAAPPPAPPVEDPQLPGFVAISPAMRRLREDVSALRGSRATVVISGESGAGKEVVARAVHALSTRARAPFVAFNCAAVPRDLFEGLLFGSKKGAFTGATADNPGVVSGAHGGTLFLDEVAELPLDVQPKLLRVLENGEVFPLGANRPVEVDVRIVAATHRDLSREVAEGRFREDLYYRLHVVPLRVPPLRERPEDVLALATQFLRALVPADRTPPRLAPDAVAALLSHLWPGNVRELRNTLERALAFGPVPPVLGAAALRLTG